MFETLTALLSVWGLALIAVFNSVGRCGVPFPSSVLMLLAGALIVSTQAELMIAVSVAYLSALAGDMAAYRLGALGGTYLDRLSKRRPKVARLMARASALSKRHGSLAVLFTRWPLSTIGPYVNLTAGALGLNWRAYMAFCVVGELVWVSLYLTLGYLGRAQVEQTIAGASRATLIGGAAVFAMAFLFWLWRRLFRKAG